MSFIRFDSICFLPFQTAEGLTDLSGEDVEQYQMEIRNTAATLLLIALVIPEAIVFLAHLFKSLFGSQPWPTMRIVLMVRKYGNMLLLKLKNYFKQNVFNLHIIEFHMLMCCIVFILIEYLQY